MARKVSRSSTGRRPGDLLDDEDWAGQVRRRRLGETGRHVVTVLAVVVGAALVYLGGTQVPVETATQVAAAPPLVGRTSRVCTMLQPALNQPVLNHPALNQPAPNRPAQGPSGSATSSSQTSVSAVAIRRAPGQAGVLTGAPLGGGTPLLTISEQGFGRQLQSPPSSVLLQGVGVMATASAGATFTNSERGETAGFMAAPCTAPATSQWFVGVGSDETHRTELVLSNPDDAQAEVDLRFYGRTGLVVVPGSPGLVVPAHQSRTVSLPSLVGRSGPLAVWVRATSGRVAAMARDLYSVNLDPAGADWHEASASPSSDLVIPGVPDGQGSRDLVVTNPGTARASVTVSVLGAAGPFSPTGAEQLLVEPGSTTTVSLAAGLAGQASGVQLHSDQPVTAAVISTSQGIDPATGSAARPDIAVQPAAAALGRTGVSAIATVPGADTELIVSNGSGSDAPVSFSVLSLDGVVLRTGDMLVAAHSTSTRRLTSAPPAYVVLDLSDGAKLYGALRLASTSGPVGGLTSLQILSPDLASGAGSAVPDPTVGR